MYMCAHQDRNNNDVQQGPLLLIPTPLINFADPLLKKLNIDEKRATPGKFAQLVLALGLKFCIN